MFTPNHNIIHTNKFIYVPIKAFIVESLFIYKINGFIKYLIKNCCYSLKELIKYNYKIKTNIILYKFS